MSASALDATPAATNATSPRLPGILVIGAMKASTTAFVELLSRHPGVWFSPEKEPHYFTSPDYGDADALRRYADLFAGAPDDAILAEASTGYSKLPDLGPTPQRIRELLGEPKLIYLLRDPVARLVSNFHHSRLAGHYSAGLTLRQAVEADPILVTASLYARQIAAYHEEFGPDALLVLTTDELHANPGAAMRQVERHLELDPFADWPEDLPSRNSRDDLGGSLAAQRIAPRSVLGMLRRFVPAGIKSRVKASLAPPPAPAPSEDDLRYAQSLIEDDLAELVEMLGERIESWPSVLRLRDRRGGTA
ncbi:MAG: sulfotransferase [Planctomycetota bacterium]